MRTCRRGCCACWMLLLPDPARQVPAMLANEITVRMAQGRAYVGVLLVEVVFFFVVFFLRGLDPGFLSFLMYLHSG